MNKIIILKILLWIVLFLGISFSYSENLSSIQQHTLSPSTSFKNKVFVFNHDSFIRQESYGGYSQDQFEMNVISEKIKDIIKSSNGKVQIYTIFYKNKYEKETDKNITFESASIKIDHNDHLNLLKNHMNKSSDTKIIFYVDDQKGVNLSSLNKWIYNNFKGEKIILLPCADDFDKYPIIEYEPFKYAHWQDWLSIIKLLEIGNIEFVGDEAVNHIKTKTQPSVNVSFDSLSTLDMVINRYN